MDARGVQLLAEGRFLEAEALFSRSLAIDPANPGTLANRSTARHKLENDDGAIADFKAAVGLRKKLKGVLAPSISRSYLRRSRALLAKGKPDDALKDLYEAVRLDRRNAEALAGIGALAVRQGDFSTALPYLDRALKLRPDMAQALRDRASALRGLGRAADAQRDETRALEISPALP